MARAAELTNGAEYTVNAGKHAGKIIKVISNTPVPDGQPNQRAILVEIDGVAEFIIPRLIDNGKTIQVRHAPTEVHHNEVHHQEVHDFVVDIDPITDPMDVRLDQYRPHPDIAKNYVSRKIADTALSDINLLMHYYNSRDERGYSPNVMLVGDTQSGKTMLVQVLAVLIAKAKGYPKPLPVFTLSGSSGVTDYDLFGQPTTYTDTSGREHLVWLPGQLDLAARVECILYLDESNMMPERVTSSLHSFTDDRRMFVNRAKAVLVNGSFMPEQVPVNTDCWVLGTYNAGYRGAGAHNEAFSNRFRHLPWDYDAAVEKKLIASPTILLLGDALREARAQRHISTPVGTKALIRLREDAKALGVTVALWAFLGLFSPQERIKVEAIIADRSIGHMLNSEFGVATATAPVSEPF